MKLVIYFSWIYLKLVKLSYRNILLNILNFYKEKILISCLITVNIM